MWPTHYQVLGIPPGASAKDIRQGYRRLARRLHPDLSRGLGAAERRFRVLAEAYTVLADPSTRRAYDEALPPPAKTMAQGGRGGRGELLRRASGPWRSADPRRGK